jgi:Fe-S cluster assembly protein SufD
MASTLESYVAEWKRAGELRQGAEPAEVARARNAAWQRFLSVGFPTTRNEEWRFTSVAPIAECAFSLATRSSNGRSVDAAAFRLPGAFAAELVFLDGYYVPELSRQGALPRGVRVESLASSLKVRGREIEPYLARVAPFERHPFVALNTAFLDDGACIELAAGTILQEPVHLLFLATAGNGGQSFMAHPRVLAVLHANSQASIVETYAGVDGSQYLTNTVTEIVLGENAVLNHCKQQFESTDAYHVGTIHVEAQRSANYTSHSISLGGALVRNDIVAVLNGEGAESTLNGLYVANEQQLVDNHTTIDHARPHCGSREIYKGILAGRARGVFNGKIIVRPDAQKTDAKQTNRALLLSEDASINTKPQLEILANDVKCTHGAAVGQLDDEALFYLRSRGLSGAAARQLLIHAFAADVLDHRALEPVRAGIEDRLHRELAQALSPAA